MKNFIINVIKIGTLFLGCYAAAIYFSWISFILLIIYLEIHSRFFKFISALHMEIDIYKQINEATDKDYLTQLDKFIDMDIAKIGKDSDEIRAIKAKLFNTTIEEYEKKQFESFLLLKKYVKQRLNELNNIKDE